MLKCMIGDYYAYYINKYAKKMNDLHARAKILLKKHLFLGVVYLSLHKLFAQGLQLFNGRIEEGISCLLKKI